MAKIGCRVRSQIYYHIPDSASRASNYLDLLVRRRLQMHSPQSPFGMIIGDIALNQTLIQTVGGKFLFTPAASEKPPFVPYWFWIDNKCTG